MLATTRKMEGIKKKILTNIRQVFWKMKGLSLFLSLVGHFIGSGSGFSFPSIQQSNINLVFSVSPPS